MTHGRARLPILSESIRVARSQPVVGAVVALITAAMVVVTVLTAGATLVERRAVEELVDQAGARTFSLIDTDGSSGIPLGARDRIEALGGVEHVLALGPIIDGRNHWLAFAEPVPLRRVAGSFPGLSWSGPAAPWAVAAVDARAASRLGLAVASGSIDVVGGSEQIPVAATYTAPGVTELAGLVLVRDPAWTGPVRLLLVRASRAEDVAGLAEAARAVSGAARPGSVRVELPAQLNEARAAISAQLRSTGRRSVLVALVVGALLTAVTVSAGVSSRRRDFGRRRALGASRSQLVRLVVGQTVTAALVGSVIGGIAGAVYLGGTAGTEGVVYSAAVTTVALAAAALGALLPAWLAARRDPLRALRVP